jgi:hypothetical protein
MADCFPHLTSSGPNVDLRVGAMHSKDRRLIPLCREGREFLALRAERVVRPETSHSPFLARPRETAAHAREEMALAVTHRQKLADAVPVIDTTSDKRYPYPFVKQALERMTPGGPSVEDPSHGRQSRHDRGA